MIEGNFAIDRLLGVSNDIRPCVVCGLFTGYRCDRCGKPECAEHDKTFLGKKNEVVRYCVVPLPKGKASTSQDDYDNQLEESLDDSAEREREEIRSRRNV